MSKSADTQELLKSAGIRLLRVLGPDNKIHQDFARIDTTRDKVTIHFVPPIGEPEKSIILTLPSGKKVRGAAVAIAIADADRRGLKIIDLTPNRLPGDATIEAYIKSHRRPASPYTQLR